MPIGIASLVILAAITHAGWNALAKYVHDQTLAFLLINLTVAIMGLGVLACVRLPATAALPFLVGSMTIHVCYNLFLLNSYRFGDLSEVYPIARGVAPILVSLGALVALGEGLTLPEILGIVIIAAAIASLAQPRERRALALSLATGLTIAAYSLVDGIGVRHTHDALSYAAALFVLEGSVLAAMLGLWRLRHGPRETPGLERIALGVLAGALSFAAYALVLFAQQHAPLALVSALRETSVVIAAGLGALVLKEPFGRRRIVSAGLVALGVAVLLLA